jgi:D-alanyl-D-alanine carboxypeptidase
MTIRRFAAPSAVLCFLAALAGCNAGANAPAPSTTTPTASQTRALDGLVTDLVSTNDTPGIAVSIARGGVTIYTKVAGNRRLRADLPVVATTPFQIGSVTKQFTSAAILLLVQDGTVALDDPLSKYVPEYVYASGMTIRGLLTMTAGVPAHDADVFKLLNPDAPPSPQIISALNTLKLDFPPGTKMAYSNYGYWLLGEVVRRVSHESYGAFLQHRIFAPLHMQSTYLYGTRGGTNEAVGYAHENQPDPWALAPDPPSQFIDAQGGLTSTVGDILRWDEAIVTQRIVADPLYTTMLTVPSLAGGAPIHTYTGPDDEGGEIIYRLNDGSPSMYAMGWMVPGGNYFWHSGGTNGFTSMNANFDDGTSIAILTNEHLGSVPVGDTIPNLAAALYRVLEPSVTTGPAFTILRLPKGNPTPEPPE